MGVGVEDVRCSSLHGAANVHADTGSCHERREERGAWRTKPAADPFEGLLYKAPWFCVCILFLLFSIPLGKLGNAPGQLVWLPHPANTQVPLRHANLLLLRSYGELPKNFHCQPWNPKEGQHMPDRVTFLSLLTNFVCNPIGRPQTRFPQTPPTHPATREM